MNASGTAGAHRKIAPEPVVVIHPDQRNRDQFTIPPQDEPEEPAGMRILLNPPLNEVGHIEVLTPDHADFSLVSRWGISPRTVAGPAVGIDRQTLGSLLVAPANGLLMSSVISTIAVS